MNLFSKTVSITVLEPSTVVKNDIKGDCISVGNPGYGRVLRSVAISFFSVAFT